MQLEQPNPDQEDADNFLAHCPFVAKPTAMKEIKSASGLSDTEFAIGLLAADKLGYFKSFWPAEAPGHLAGVMTAQGLKHKETLGIDTTALSR